MHACFCSAHQRYFIPFRFLQQRETFQNGKPICYSDLCVSAVVLWKIFINRRNDWVFCVALNVTLRGCARAQWGIRVIVADAGLNEVKHLLMKRETIKSGKQIVILEMLSHAEKLEFLFECAATPLLQPCILWVHCSLFGLRLWIVFLGGDFQLY